MELVTYSARSEDVEIHIKKQTKKNLVVIALMLSVVFVAKFVLGNQNPIFDIWLCLIAGNMVGLGTYYSFFKGKIKGIALHHAGGRMMITTNLGGTAVLAAVIALASYITFFTTG